MAGTVGERLAAKWELSQQAWWIAGLPIPQYDRAHMPILLVPLGQGED